MTDDKYTPRMRVKGTYSNIQDRKQAVRDLLGSNRKASNNVVTYLQGYYDALNLVEAEVRDLRDAEIMGHDVTECESE